MESKNKEKLDSFVAHCKAHPDERFWQALRNWAGVDAVCIYENNGGIIDYEDTFYWE